MSIQDGINKYGEDKDIIVMMHYPPVIESNMENVFTEVLKKYGVKTCIYGHLHGAAHKTLVDGMIDGINYIMVSCDYTKFDVIKIVE
jgi:predicted phosphohydrolase